MDVTYMGHRNKKRGKVEKQRRNIYIEINVTPSHKKKAMRSQKSLYGAKENCCHYKRKILDSNRKKNKGVYFSCMCL